MRAPGEAATPMKPVLAIVGPTASGKTALAVGLGHRLGGDVVSTDSMQVYRGMDVGTATPSAAERSGIEHHMVDIWDPDHDVTVAEFQARARTAIDQVRSRGRVALVTGGSGLYVAAVLDEMDFPGADPDVRQRLELEADERGGPWMHQRLEMVDPKAAVLIPASNVRRVIRALEVNEITGASYAAQLPQPVSVYPTVHVGLRISREDLDARIALRVDAMFEGGLVEEVELLLARDVVLGRTAVRALGYSQVLALLRGEITREQARDQTVDATKRFARRQQRWFRRDTRITWLDFDAPDLADQVVGLWEESSIRL